MLKIYQAPSTNRETTTLLADAATWCALLDGLRAQRTQETIQLIRQIDQAVARGGDGPSIRVTLPRRAAATVLTRSRLMRT